jgi:AraC-like DNA-binding protein
MEWLSWHRNDISGTMPLTTLTSLIPAELLTRPHVATRYLYAERKPGRLTCLFQRHPIGLMHQFYMQAFPSALDRDRNYKAREDRRIYAASFVLAGAGLVTYRDTARSYELQPGSLFQFSGHAMADLRLETGEGFTECSFSLDGDTGRRLADLEVWDPSVRVAHAGQQVSIAAAYLDLYRATLDHSRPARSLLRQCCQLLEHLYSFLGDADSGARFRSRACALLDANLQPSFTMRQAANLLDMPYDAFRRRFRTDVGMAPITYQLRRRVEQACLLLQQHTAGQTAAILGYADQFVFSRQFKKLTGLSPREYQGQMGR